VVHGIRSWSRAQPSFSNALPGSLRTTSTDCQRHSSIMSCYALAEQCASGIEQLQVSVIGFSGEDDLNTLQHTLASTRQHQHAVNRYSPDDEESGHVHPVSSLSNNVASSCMHAHNCGTHSTTTASLSTILRRTRSHNAKALSVNGAHVKLDAGSNARPCTYTDVSKLQAPSAKCRIAPFPRKP